MLPVPFPEQLKQERLRRGWSQEDLAERIGSDPKTIQRWEGGRGLPRPHHRQRLYEVLGKTPEELGLLREPAFDWRERPDTSSFFGRKKELQDVKRWLKHCRLIAVLGIGGIGKTTFVAQLVEEVSQDEDGDLDYGYWCSLRSAPPLLETLRNCITFFSERQQIELPPSEEEQIGLLMELLRRRHCLLVLDNFDSLLQGGQRAGQYRAGYEGYGRLLERLGNEQHLSAVLLTSREKPREISRLEGAQRPVRSLTLAGIGSQAGRAILEEKGISGTNSEVEALVTRYAGNPLALSLVAETIHEIFGGQIAAFLAENQAAIGDVRDLLEQHLSRLAPREREVLYWLAIEQDAVTREEIRADLVRPEAQRELIETLDSLRRRSLIEVHEQGAVSLQPVIMEYVQDELLRQAYEDFLTGSLETWAHYAFVKAQARDYIRESQRRLLLAPLAEMLRSEMSSEAFQERLLSLLEMLRRQRWLHSGYTAGNLLNLLVHLRWDMRGLDFSSLTIRQAYLQGARLPEVNFANARFSGCLFQDTLANVLSSAFSPDGERLALGTAGGEVRIYEGDGATLRQALRGHSDGVWSLAFSSDGRLLASSSDDQTIRLWESESGRCLQILEGHSNRVRALALTPDARLLISGSDDRTIRFWEVQSGSCLRMLTGHEGRIWAVAVSPTGDLLASGDTTGSLRIWSLQEPDRPPILLEGHSDQIRSLSFSSDGRLLASGGDDRTIRLWEVAQQRARLVLQGHTNRVWAVAFSPDDALVASGSEDSTIRLWNSSSGHSLAVLSGHTHGVRTLSFHPDRQRHLLVSGGDDQAICLWDMQEQRCLVRLQGYTTRLWSLAFSPDGEILAAASEGEGIVLWDPQSGSCRRRLHDSAHIPLSLAFSPDGRLLASGGEDQTIRLWPLHERRPPLRLEGHTKWIRALAFSPDGSLLASGGEDEQICLWNLASGSLLTRLSVEGWIRALAFQPGDGQPGLLLASGGDDQTLRLWDLARGVCLHTLTGHHGRIRALAFSPDGSLLASGGEDAQVILWDARSGTPVQHLLQHRGRVRCVSFSGDGQLLASSGDDLQICLWDPATGSLQRRISSEHTQTVRALCFAPHGSLLASGGNDGLICLWNALTGRLLGRLSAPRPYEGMNITGVEGLSEAQKNALLALGAFEGL